MQSYFGKVTQLALCFRREKKSTTVTLAGGLNTFLIVLWTQQQQQILNGRCLRSSVLVESLR